MYERKLMMQSPFTYNISKTSAHRYGKVLVDEEEGPQLTYAVQNHFKALAMKEGKTRRSSVHHQSLVTMSRK